MASIDASISLCSLLALSCSLFSAPRSSLALVSLSLLVARSLPSLPLVALASAPLAWLSLCFLSSLRSGGCGFPLAVAPCSLFEGFAL